MGIGRLVVALMLKRLEQDRALPDYTPGPLLNGALEVVASDTMNNLLSLLRETLLKHHPDSKLEINSIDGCMAGANAFTLRPKAIVPMGSPLTATEIERIEAKTGLKPTQVVVSY